MKIKGRKHKKELTAAIEQGRELLQERKEPEALEFLEEAVRRFPEDPQIRLFYATILLAFRPEDVATEAAKAVELDPDNPAILVSAGHRLLFGGEREAAKSCAVRAEELVQPDSLLIPSLLNLKGSIAALNREDDLAEDNLRSAMEGERDNGSFARNLAVFLAERGRLQEAVAVLDEALKHVEDKDALEHMRTRMVSEIVE